MARRSIPNDMAAVIHDRAEVFGVPEQIVRAVVWVESSARWNATRYEKHYRWFVGKPTGAERRGQATSWGACIAEGQPVLSEHGWLPIEDIQPGDRVLSTQGKLREVLATQDKGINECLTIQTGLNLPITCTPGHELFVRRSEIAKWNTGRNKIVMADHPEWAAAGTLKPWDYVAYPAIHEIRDIDVFDAATLFVTKEGYKVALDYNVTPDRLFVAYKKSGKQRCNVRRWIPVDRAFMELCGLYLAEGSPLDKRKGIAFAFHEKETDLHRRVVELVHQVFDEKANARIDYDNNSKGVKVSVYGLGARLLAELLPGNAKTKQIPMWVLWLPPEKQKWLFFGAFLGDGCRRRAHIATASQSLALGLLHILHRIGIVGKITINKSKDGRVWHQVLVNSHDNVSRLNESLGNITEWVQTESLGKRRNNSTHWKRDDDFIYFPVRNVSGAEPSRVFDLQVDKDEAFCVGRSLVHNCQVMGAVAREHGFKGRFEDLNGEAGIHYGCKHLAGYYRRFKTWDAACRAYNTGRGKRTLAGDRYLAKIKKMFGR